MSETKQVKVDNWGIYFLQRLKHFFNRTDYCDLTLQFQDNAQLKVHRLVLSACTEYFELLERTCEMYEDCLVMPDDLQADVVVPIVNFMYTGQLEFKLEILERLYQTSQIMNMPVLTKLLNAQRAYAPNTRFQNSSTVKHYSKSNNVRLPSKQNTTLPLSSISSCSSKSSNKRPFTKAFEKTEAVKEIKTSYHHDVVPSKKKALADPRPTRYELPEELDVDNVFESSFSSLSYDSKPLMVHPETKQYSSKRSHLFNNSSGSKKILGGTSTLDIVECKRVRKNENIFDDGESDMITDDLGVFGSSMLNVRDEVSDPNQLFDKIMDNEEGPKVIFETKDNKKTSKIDHAKIISEVLKKYPHLVKSNKNIKLKILDTPQKSKPRPVKVEKVDSPKPKATSDYTYESDVLDSQEAAKLIAMGAENTTGPWICLICGTPGKALHFSSYFKFRRHLVEVHNEKPIANMCEYCGLKSLKRNYLLHHIYTKHGVDPPPQYRFPKCNMCNYVALTEGFLIKHKMSHTESKSFRCNVCPLAFYTSQQLLSHIQVSGHKYGVEKKSNLQCIYCMKQFMRETNLYTHLKLSHKSEAKIDGIIDDSDEEEVKPILKPSQDVIRPSPIKYEPLSTLEIEYEGEQSYQIQEKPESNYNVTKKLFTQTAAKQKILNPGFSMPVTKSPPKTKPVQNIPSVHNAFLEDAHIPSPPDNNPNEEIIIIGDNEYIIRENQLIPRKGKIRNEYILSDILPQEDSQTVVTTASPVIYNNLHNINYQETLSQSKMLKKPMAEINQPIQIVVSNEEEYKALMASNHPIMFDDTNAGKTLTVLTTPHTTQLNTAGLSLENAQSNDMMIIQQEYQMTPISETVSMDNSNIVVVYSHSADHQNKPYQLITSQGLGGQIIQSPAMITQNYSTMTTATPVMSAQIMDQHAQIWQNNVHHDIGNHEVEIASEQQYQEIAVVAEQTEITPNENETNLEHLPEVHLMHETQTMPSLSNEENMNQPSDVSNVNTTHSMPGVIIDETQTQPSDVSNVNITHSMPGVIIDETHTHPSDVSNVNITHSMPGIVIDETQTQPSDVSNVNITHSMPGIVIDETQNLSVIKDHNLSEATMEVVHTCTPVNVTIQSDLSTLNSSNITVNVQEHTELAYLPKTVVEELVINTEEQTQSAVDIQEQTFEETSNNMTTPLASQPDDEVNDGECSAIDTYDHTCLAQNNSQGYGQVAVIVPAIPPKTKEQIQNLTSEWSDEDEITTQGQKTDENTKTTVENEASSKIDNSDSENIQQEMAEATEGNTEIVNTVSENDVPNSLEPEQLNVDKTNLEPVNPPLEKISSLLIDWEENDSQEENPAQTETSSALPSEIEQAQDKSVNDEVIKENENPTTDDENTKLNSNVGTDKIKILVSDWDEDDEEKKE